MNDNATANNLAKCLNEITRHYEYNLSPWTEQSTYSYLTEKDFVETDEEDVGDNKVDSKFDLENIML